MEPTTDGCRVVHYSPHVSDCLAACLVSASQLELQSLALFQLRRHTNSFAVLIQIGAAAAYAVGSSIFHPEVERNKVAALNFRDQGLCVDLTGV